LYVPTTCNLWQLVVQLVTSGKLSSRQVVHPTSCSIHLPIHRSSSILYMAIQYNYPLLDVIQNTNNNGIQ